MARPPHAREKVLLAYAQLLVEGERAATMDAVATRAGVSKGGVLYHFPSKDALAEALLGRFAEVSAADVKAMQDDPDGPVRNFIRTSWETDADLDPVYRAVMRLAHAGHEGALGMLESLHDDWLRELETETGDAALAKTVMLLGDGLYHQASMPGRWSQQQFSDLDELLAQVDRLLGR
ncbi:TetR/AcrR family transcriptional regulator [Nocardioides yefusunii]|uniref:TetR/AcrR family transcriptional regulator n=1 Tax=Nocardioides yefusunii TaxID=2500546 RepID=A0ABW1QUB7_9ACTN|nr:TetR/AcrR family transcriptional regulator [Nocardioides yefusunii]